ncbi:GNAT family N-acetyltransferase [Desulfobacter sp.]|uniref:GNAT family N-acetyltransferase n=1 Tax=Desulfobacter sp. TaxID=2294 RepID=UPI003D0AC6BA
MNIIISRPAGDEDRQGVYRFLYRIWVQECGRELPGTDHTLERIRDDLDDWADHFVAMDEQGQVVGCVRVNRLSRGRPDQGLVRSLGFEPLSGLFDPETIVFISHLAVLPAYRGGTVISLLLADMFRHLLETRVNVALCICRLGMVSLYHRLGMRPYLPNFDRHGQMQVPLVGCINDREYLSKTGSPLHLILPQDRDDHGWAAGVIKERFPMFATPLFTRITHRSLWAQLAYASPAITPEPSRKLFQDIPEAVLEVLLPNLPRIFLSNNETVQVNTEWEAAMGILIDGALGVGVGEAANPHFIYLIRPGEPFGELITLARIRSSTVILALEDSEVVLLPEHLFDQLGRKDPGTAIQLYKNLLTILARRTAAANTALADHLSKKKTGPDAAVRSPSRHMARSIRTAVRRTEARTESYHFDTLSDPQGEFARLSCQAKIAEVLEFSRLRQIGLTDGDRILDLGSGPGITSLLLARNFPSSQVFGVEPEAKLRSRAVALAREQASEGRRCRFLEGTAQAIPLDDASVDFAYARLLFQHIPDPLVCLREMRRVTRPGGIVCILDVDDGTIFIHPEVPGWKAVEARVARAQAGYGGDRHVGRKLLGYFGELGFAAAQVDIVPVTTQMLGPSLFFDIVFGFKQQHLKRYKDWDLETEATFKQLGATLMEKGAFASENIFVAHGSVP